jgi:hypothetical protein
MALEFPRSPLSGRAGPDGHGSGLIHVICAKAWHLGVLGIRREALAGAIFASLALAGCDDVAAAFDDCQPLEAEPGTIVPIVPCP